MFFSLVVDACCDVVLLLVLVWVVGFSLILILVDAVYVYCLPCLSCVFCSGVA